MKVGHIGIWERAKHERVIQRRSVRSTPWLAGVFGVRYAWLWLASAFASREMPAGSTETTESPHPYQMSSALTADSARISFFHLLHQPLAASLMWAIVGSGSSSSSSSSCSPDLRHMYSLPGVISHVMCHYARGVYQKPAVFLGNILGAHFFPGKHRTLHLMRFDHQPKQRHLLREP